MRDITQFTSAVSLMTPIRRVLMDNFSPEQYDRFEAYRRHALPKQAVRKVSPKLDALEHPKDIPSVRSSNKPWASKFPCQLPR